MYSFVATMWEVSSIVFRRAEESEEWGLVHLNLLIIHFVDYVACSMHKR